MEIPGSMRVIVAGRILKTPEDRGADTTGVHLALSPWGLWLLVSQRTKGRERERERRSDFRQCNLPADHWK